ncbi:hypothetical protein GF389_03770 [Candidatus Dojkabacteria bacterium]|nr:hypothetical protein [Candidatus Dojkabacteria bacterium]
MLCFLSGEVELNEEYSEYKWVDVDGLVSFQPLIENVPEMVRRLLKLVPLMKDDEFMVI